ncbi:MAG TPA: hypothetical protein VMW24_03235 [Sedimentisphaerales bacterium]|nr:hypothetical protein [Sedimentisphaerales bacterium]
MELLKTGSWNERQGSGCVKIAGETGFLAQVLSFFGVLWEETPWGCQKIAAIATLG